MTTKSDLVDAVASATGYSKYIAKDVIDAAFGQIVDQIIAGEKVQIAHFGSFEKKATAARMGRNPVTGAVVDIPAGHKVSFKAAADLKAKL